MKTSEEIQMYNFLKSLNFNLKKVHTYRNSRKMTKNRKEFEWVKGTISVSYEISKDLKKKNYNKIINRDIQVKRNNISIRHHTINAFKNDVAINRMMKLSRLKEIERSTF